MSKKPIVVVGSLNIDRVTHVERIPARGETLPGRDFGTYPGGKGRQSGGGRQPTGLSGSHDRTCGLGRVWRGAPADAGGFGRIEVLTALGARNIALKLGAQGAYMGLTDGTRAPVPAFAVNAADTTGAGDAFNGAFAVALARGEGPRKAARFAAAAAAASVTRCGTLSSMPRRADVDSLMERDFSQELAR